MTYKYSEPSLTVAAVQSGGSKEFEGDVALNLIPDFVRLKHARKIAVETRLLRAHDLQASMLLFWVIAYARRVSRGSALEYLLHFMQEALRFSL